MTKSMAVELAPDNIRANAINPVLSPVCAWRWTAGEVVENRGQVTGIFAQISKHRDRG